MNVIRVLQVVRIMDRGGAETLLMNIMRKLDCSKVQFDFLVHVKEVGEYEEEIIDLGGKISRLAYITDIGIFAYKKRLFRFFRDNPYCIVHSHLNEVSTIVLGQAKKAGVPVRIAHSHNYYPKYSFIEGLYRTYLRRKINNQVTHQFGCSEQALEWLFGKVCKNRKVIKNGALLENYTSKSPNNKQLVVGHIGSFSAQKNHKFMIEILHELAILKPESCFKLIGDGVLRGKMELLVRSKSISKNVHFLGVRSDIPDLLAQMDLFLMPSLHEGLPLTLIEAQAAGLDCLITDTITEEVDMGCGMIHRMSLNDKAIEWARKIVHIVEHKKEVNSHPFIKKAGFDIVDTSIWLTNFYINCNPEAN